MAKRKKVQVVTDGPSEAERRKWEAEEAARTLTRAEEIRADRGLYGRAKSVLARQQKALDRVLGGK